LKTRNGWAALQDRGYFKALTSEPVTHIRDAAGSIHLRCVPVDGKRIDVLIAVERERGTSCGITFTGNKEVTT